MFLRRLRKGQQYHAPYLGCREFAAIVESADGAPPPDDTGDRPLGLMFYDFDWAGFNGGPIEPLGEKETVRPLFFPARLVRGVVHVPMRDEVRAMAARQP